MAGNVPDPRGGDLRGVEAGYDFTGGALGHPQIWTPFVYKGVPLVLEPDVYDDHIHLICPVCLVEERGEHGLRIRKDAKAYEYEPLREPPTFPGWTPDQMRIAFPNGLRGRLSVEPFRCTWESQADLSRGFGLQKCSFSASIRNNVLVME